MSHLVRLSLQFPGVNTWYEVTSPMSPFLFVLHTILMTSLKDTQRLKKHLFREERQNLDISISLSLTHTRRIHSFKYTAAVCHLRLAFEPVSGC